MNQQFTTYRNLFFVSLFISSFFFFGDFKWYEVCSISIFFFFILKFAFDLGKDLSIKNIIAIIASMQYLLGAVLGYVYDEYVSYQMQVPKEEYFSFALPATIFYFIGIFWPLNKVKDKKAVERYPINYYRKGRLLIIIGFIAGFLPLGFLGYILGGLKFVGLFYMLSSNNRFKYYWVIPVFGSLILSVLASTMFHELILWGCFALMMFFLFKKSKFIYRLGIIAAGLTMIMVIQLVKKDYRLAVSNKPVNANNVELFITQIKNRFSGDNPWFSVNDIGNNVDRLNQGWIISRVMANVPDHTPFANGATIEDALIASIFPRFLLPDKAVANGHSNMLAYADTELNEWTSMDIGQVGEAYANFGIIGGVAFMFIFGLFLNWIISFLERKIIKYPDLIFWIPLIFLQAIKAETDVATILNHITKTLIVTWAFFSPIGKKILNSKIS